MTMGLDACKALKLLTGKGRKPVISLRHSLFLREGLLGAEKSQQHVGIFVESVWVGAFLRIRLTCASYAGPA